MYCQSFFCMDVPARETEKSRIGYKYEAAGGHIINEGEKDIAFLTSEGNLCNMSFRIAEIHKGLWLCGRPHRHWAQSNFRSEWILHGIPSRTQN